MARLAPAKAACAFRTEPTGTSDVTTPPRPPALGRAAGLEEAAADSPDHHDADGGAEPGRPRGARGGLEHAKARIFPDSALEYAGGGEIPELGISCGYGSGRAPARVNQVPLADRA
jgi:hypothetical protein